MKKALQSVCQLISKTFGKWESRTPFDIVCKADNMCGGLNILANQLLPTPVETGKLDTDRLVHRSDKALYLLF